MITKLVCLRKVVHKTRTAHIYNIFAEFTLETTITMIRRPNNVRKECDVNLRNSVKVRNKKFVKNRLSCRNSFECLLTMIGISTFFFVRIILSYHYTMFILIGSFLCEHFIVSSYLYFYIVMGPRL